MCGTGFVFQQWFTGFAVTLLILQPGLMGGWCSPTLARLMSPESPIPLDPHQASWVAALANLGRFFGTIVGSIMASVIGSKRTISVTLWPLTLGWLCVFLADSATWLYAARTLQGVGLGMALSAFPLYIGEVSMPEIRGALISLATVGAPAGQVIASLCSAYLSIPQAAGIYLILALLLVFVFFWLPDSPYHLVKAGNQRGAHRAIYWYRAGIDVDRELDAVETFVTGSGEKSFSEKLKEFRTPEMSRATLRVIALFGLMQISGGNSVLFYMETILTNAKFNLINPALVVIYVNIISIGASMVSVVLIDRCGRRFLLIISSASVTLAMLALSAHFYLLGQNKSLPGFEWVPMVSLFLFIPAFFFGLFPVPCAILSETFPANIKSIASFVATTTGAITSFLATKMYQPMVDSMGETYVFLTYAIFASVIIPYTLIDIPETKGKSLQQIQDELNRKSGAKLQLI